MSLANEVFVIKGASLFAVLHCVCFSGNYILAWCYAL